MRFSIGRVAGTPKWVELYTVRGTVRIERRSEWSVHLKAYEVQQLIPGLAMLDPDDTVVVPTQDYDDHFLFEAPSDIQGPAYLCSCGSSAGFYGSAAYAHGASAGGLKLHCDAVLRDGKHADLVT